MYGCRYYSTSDNIEYVFPLFDISEYFNILILNNKNNKNIKIKKITNNK